MQTSNNEPNVWRTIVIVAVCMIAGVFMWQFLTRSSSDVMALFLGIFVFGGPAGFMVGYICGPGTQKHMQAYNEGYRRGYITGADIPTFSDGSGGECEVVVWGGWSRVLLVRRTGSSAGGRTHSERAGTSHPPIFRR